MVWFSSFTESKTTSTSSRPLLLERLEDRLLMDAAPDVNLDVPAEVFLEESFSVTATFDNTSTTDVGFGPFIDLFVPTGVDFSGATYLGQNVNTINVGTFDATGAILGTTTHPLTGETLAAGTPGDTLYVLELPFGSFVPNQPQAELKLNMKLNGAPYNVPLDIKAQAGFRFGNDELNNPATDPPIRGALQTDQVTPQVIALSKSHDGPEGETATGPNFLRTYTLTVDIAEGAVVRDLEIIDLLPDNLVYQGISLGNPTIGGAATVTGTTIVDQPLTTGPQNAPNNDLKITFDSAVGTSSSSDITITYTAYVPEFDANGDRVLPEFTGAPTNVINTTTADAVYDPDGVEATANITLPQEMAQSTLVAKSIATQKGVSVVGGGDPLPGKTLEYTIEVQISDYFSFDTLKVKDNFSDGQLFDGTFTPTLSLNDNGASLATINFDAANFSVIQNSPGDGSSDVEFRVSDEMLTQALPDGRLQGDNSFDAFGGGGTVATIKFRTVIQENFTDTFPSGDRSVDLGDKLTNDVEAVGRIILDPDETPASFQRDTSSASVEIIGLTVEKSVAFVNGVAPGAGSVEIAPGDQVTYLLRANLPTLDIENFTIRDYLPLPIFAVSELAGGANFSAAKGSVPTAGTFNYGSGHTLDTEGVADPSIGVEDGNAFTISFGSFDFNSSPAGVAEILFTVTATDKPFADGLFLTNQQETSYGSTQNSSITAADIVQVIVRFPELELKKGVIGTDNASGVFSLSQVGPTGITFAAPGSSTDPFSGGNLTAANLSANPIDSNLKDVDAGDLVRFGVVITNTGGRDAFDMLINDTIPDGFKVPTAGMNFAVHLGDGSTDVNFTAADGSAIATADIDDHFFTTGSVGTGIRLVDFGAVDGALGRGDIKGTNTAVTDGSNVILITYDLEIVDTAEALTEQKNTAEILEYAAQEGGNDYTLNNTGNWQDDATVTILAPSIESKTITATSITDSQNSFLTQATIGETVTYQITLKVGEGETTGAYILDNLDAGLAFIGINSVTVTSGDLTSTRDLSTFGQDAGETSTTDATEDIYLTNNGQTIQFNLGDLDNDNRDNTTDETIVISYDVVVLNVTGNQHGTGLNNTARINWVDNVGTQPTVSATDVTVVEPNVTVDVKAEVGSLGSGVTNGDANDTVFYTIRIEHDNTTPGAYEVNLEDTLPTALLGATIVGGSFSTNVAGLNVSNFAINSGKLEGTTAWDMDDGEFVEIVVSGTLATGLETGALIENDATINWSTMDGDIQNVSTFNTASDERTGADGVGSGLNNLAATDDADVTISAVGVDKTFVSTNQVHTTGQNVAIGELVTYSVTLTLPEANSTNFVFTDTLDSGLALVSLDSLIADPSLSTSLATGFTNILSDATIPVGGGSFTLNFGNITNSDTNNAIPEEIQLSYTVVVTNEAGNNRAVELDNEAKVTTDNLNVTDSGDKVTIVEPQLTVATVIRDGGMDKETLNGNAADTVTFRITIDHDAVNSDADAFNVTLSDVLPAGFTYVAASLTHISGKVPDTLDDTGGNISASWDSLTMTEQSVIEFQAITDSTVTPGSTLTNTANINWSSLPGDVTTSQSTNTTLGVERTGDTSDPGGAQNDYSASDPASFIVSVPSISKTISSISPGSNTGTNVSIGETINYQIVVTVPEGTSPTAIFSDFFNTSDVTMEVTGATLQALPVGTNLTYGNPTPTVSITDAVGSDGLNDTVTIDFSSITNTPDGTEDVNDQFIVDVTARVVDITANAAGDTITNTGKFQYGADATTQFVQDTVSVNLVEPKLEISKTPGATEADPGETISYTIVVEHDDDGVGTDSTGIAYDVNVTDAIATVAGLTNFTFVSATTNLGASVGSGITDNSAGGNLDIVADSLALNEVLTITFTAEVISSIAGGLPITNTGEVEYSSQSGTVTGERTYNEDDDATVTTRDPELTITKTADKTTADAADVVTYTLTVEHAATSTQDAYDLEITDLVSGLTGISLTSLTSAVISGGATSGVISTSTVGGDLTVESTVLEQGRTLTIIFTGTVDNDVQSGIDIENTSNLRWDNVSGAGGVEETDDDDHTVSIDSPDVDKTIVTVATDTSISDTTSARENAALPDLLIGELVTFTLTTTIAEGVTDDLVIRDNLPTGTEILQYVSHSITNTGANLETKGGGALAAPTVTVGASNEFVSFDYGDIQNLTFDDTVTTADQIVITVTALVVDNAANANEDVATNTLQVSHTVGGSTETVTDTQQVDIVEPVLNIEKTAATTTIDGDDVVEYTLTISHTTASNANAFDLSITDTLSDTDITLKAGTITINSEPAGANGVVDATEAAAGRIKVDFDQLLLTDTNIVIKYQVEINPAVAASETIDNTANLTYYNRDSGSLGASPDNVRRESTDSDTEQVVIVGPALTKTVTSSSVSGTTNSQYDPRLTDLTVGEIVTFQIQATIPEGTTPSVKLFDFLPGNASNPEADGFLSLVAGSIAFTLDASTNLTLGSSNITEGANGFEIDFGNVVNTPDSISDAKDIITVTYKARVTNVSANQAADVLTNVAKFTYTGGTDVTATADVEIVEPELTISKASVVSPNPGDAGDTVTFLVKISNDAFSSGSRSAAFDVDITDNLVAAGLTLDTGSIGFPGGTPAGVTDLSSGGNLHIRINQMELTDDVTITYTATLGNTVTPNQTITNTANVTWSSLPGTASVIQEGNATQNEIQQLSILEDKSYTITFDGQTTASITAGSTAAQIETALENLSNITDVTVTDLGSGQFNVEFNNPGNTDVQRLILDYQEERDGAGGVNNYSASDTADVKIKTPTITKAVNSSSFTETGASQHDPGITDLNIGEEVTFYITVDLIEGTTTGTVTDALPPDMDFVSASVVSVGSAITGGNLSAGDTDTSSGFISESGGNVTFNFGTVVNNFNDGTGTNVSDGKDQIVLAVTARVQDVAANKDAREVSGTATLNYGTGTATASAKVEIVEPVLLVTKTANDKIADAGDEVQYTVVVNHDFTKSTGPAFDVVIADNLAAAGIALKGGAIDSINISGSGVVTASTENANGYSYTVSKLEASDTITIVYTGILQDSAAPGGTVKNTVTVDYDSASGTSDRDATQISDTQTVTVPGTITIDKNISTTSENETTGNDVAIGEVITYSVDITLTEGTHANLQLKDSVPKGLQVDTSTIAIDATGFSGAAPTVASFSGGGSSGSDVTINFNTIVVPGTITQGGTSTFKVTYQATVLDISSNTAGRDRTNSAEVENTATGLKSNKSTETVNVVLPNLTVTKSVDDTTPVLGQELTYTLVIENEDIANGATAFDLIIDDVFPANKLTGITITSVEKRTIATDALVATLTNPTPSATGFTANVDELAEGQKIVITYKATVTKDSSEIGGSFGGGDDFFDNNVKIYWDSLSNNDLNTVRGGTGSDGGDRDFGAGTGTEVHNQSTDDAQDTQRVTIRGADLTVTKASSATSLVPGQTFEYTITVTNVGNAQATGVSLSEQMPNNLIINSITVDGTGVTIPATLPTAPNATNGTNNDFTLSLADLDESGGADDSHTIVINVTVANFIDASSETLSNQASATFTGIGGAPPVVGGVVDPTTGGNTGIVAAATITARPDLQVTKVERNGLTNVNAGQSIIYDITIKNVGSQAANTTLVDNFSTALLDFVSAPAVGSSSAGVFNAGAGTITWNVGSIGAAGSGSDTITLTVNATVKNPIPSGFTTIPNTATASFTPNIPGDTDPTPANNTDNYSLTLPDTPDLAIVKTASEDELEPGDQVTFTFDVLNIGPQNSTGVTVSDVLDSNFIYISSTGGTAGGTFDAATNTVSWNLGAVAGSSTQREVLTVTVELDNNFQEFSISNTVTVKDDGLNGLEFSFSNNTSVVELEVFSFVYDVNVSYNPFDSDPEDEWYGLEEIEPWRPPALTLAPIYSGHAEPGTTLSIFMYDVKGQVIGSQTVIADAGGNWLATFPSSVVYEMPHFVIIGQSKPSYSTEDHHGFNLRTYFAPATHTGMFFYEEFTVNQVFAKRAAALMQTSIDSAEDPFNFDWSKSYYEFLGSQGLPSGY